MKFNHLLLVLCIAFVACNNDLDVVPDNTEKNSVENVLATDSVKVNELEINNILKSVLNKPETRANNFTMETISDEEGNPLIYVVNYENNGGFVLISATKNYFPVLAYNETGNFDLNTQKPLGLNQWQNSIEQNIATSQDLPADKKHVYKTIWKQFEIKEPQQISAQSRAIESSEEYLEAQSIAMNKRMELQSQGYEIYEITEEITGNASLDNEIRDYARYNIYPVYEEYWDVLSFVAHNPNPDEYTSVPNFVNNVWDQGPKNHVMGGPQYNSGFPTYNTNGDVAPVGCGGLATAKVMHYYQYPTYFNWADMPSDSPTATISSFLRQVAEACNSVYGSQTLTNQEDCLQALRYYGYSGNKASHNAERTWNNIKQRKPVMMRGQTSIPNSGHAWVATGGKYTFYDVRYELWTFYSDTYFKCMMEYPDIYQKTYMFYMNWGWGSGYDGFYLDEETGDPGTHLLYTNRSNIYDITPNN